MPKTTDRITKKKIEIMFDEYNSEEFHERS